MSYGSQDPYEPYDPYGQYGPQGQEPYDPYQQPPQGEGYGYGGEQYVEYREYQEYTEYAEYQEPGYQEYQEPYPAEAGAPDPQWAMSGMGWEQQAWDEARLGVSPLQEYEGGSAGPATATEPSHTPGRGSRRRAPAVEEDYDGYQGLPEQPGESDAWDVPERRPEPARDAESDRPEPLEPARPAGRAAPAAAASEPANPVRGALGAAGLGAILAVAALASASAVLVVVALVQLGIAYGWQLAAGLGKNGRGDRRATVLTALTGWAASGAAFQLTGDQDQLGIPAALGVGFLLLAADQTLRKRAVVGEGEQITALAIAVGGGLFAALPAAFVVAARIDTGLTAACASAAAIGVLCCALLGREPIRGVFAALIPGAVVGALAASSFSASGGLKAGAFGGAVAAVAAAAGAGALARMAKEGELRGSVRIAAQTLPIGLASIGALFATAMFR